MFAKMSMASHVIWGTVVKFSSTSSAKTKALLDRTRCVYIPSSNHDEEETSDNPLPYLFNQPGAELAKEETTTEKHGKRISAHIYIHMTAHGFKPIPHIIGHGGRNLRQIASETGAKVRVRGRGSGHLECGSEAPTPLMIAVTSSITDPVGFKKAFLMTINELDTVELRLKNHCLRKNCLFEGHAYSIGHLVGGAEEILRDHVKGIPIRQNNKIHPFVVNA